MRQRRSACPVPTLRICANVCLEPANVARGASSRVPSVSGSVRPPVSTWRRIARVEGRLAAKPHSGGGRPRLDAPALATLHALGIEDNHATLCEYAGRVAERT